MIKAVLSFLSLVLIALLIGQSILLASWRRQHWLGRSALVLLGTGTLLLFVASLPIVADHSVGLLERQFSSPEPALLESLDVMVILDGGSTKSRDAKDYDLGGVTYSRVVCGVRQFKRSGAQWLVMSGSSGTSREARDGDLMRALAIEMGLRPNQVLLEPYSRNTFEHPRELSKIPQVRQISSIGVVTSAWHLPRVMREFRRQFPKVVAIPCGWYGTLSHGGVLDYVPQAWALSVSTTMLHEYVGLAWYGARDALHP